MVQRKAGSKIGSQTKSRKEPANPERHHQASHQQQGTINRGGGGSDPKKKVKKMPSVEITDLETGLMQINEPSSRKKPSAKRISPALPNYMKPTSCSDARKEQSQVSNQSPPASNRKNRPRNLKSDCPKPSSSCPDASGLKAAKTLTRKSSLKSVRSWIKKSLGFALPPKLQVNRATCSSTQKDSKFPEALDLNPGGTEAEGTSAMKVCPYTYCSLNGHRHDPLPPLKGFLASRRKLLKTQKSMKLKGQSPFRKRGFHRPEREMDTAQADISRAPSGLAIASLLGEDFFVEIFAKPQEQMIESASHEERSIHEEGGTESPEVLVKLPAASDDESTNSKENDDRDFADEIRETKPDKNIGDDMDRNSDLSIEEMDSMMYFLEYVSCDQPGEVKDALGKDSEGPEESKAKVAPTEATNPAWEKDVESLSPEPEITLVARGIAESDEELSYERVGDHGNTMAHDGGRSEVNDVQFNGGKEKGSDHVCIMENISDLSSLGCEEVVFEKIEEQSDIGHAVVEGKASEPSDLQAKHDSDGKSTGQASFGDGTGEENWSNERDQDTSSLSGFQPSESTETDNNMIEGYCSQSDMATIVSAFNDTYEEGSAAPEALDFSLNNRSDDCNTEGGREFLNIEQLTGVSETETNISDDDDVDEDYLAALGSPEEDQIIGMTSKFYNQTSMEASDEQRARLRIMRRRTEELERLKDFNPRAPHFLPEEPDPEAEKVDLRHQMMDERKNAEEWMVDYALRRAVTKLAPARRKKVALLVEAFETVLPLTTCEKPLQQASADYGQARPMQTCS